MTPLSRFLYVAAILLALADPIWAHLVAVFVAVCALGVEVAALNGPPLPADPDEDDEPDRPVSDGPIRDVVRGPDGEPLGLA